MTHPIIFISYSHQDEAWKDRLLTQLKVLALEGAFELWEDRRIAAGEEWQPAIEKAMNQAALAILLISADFLTSNFIRGEEVPRLLQRRNQEGMRIFPIILRPCPWQRVKWLAPLQVRPKDGQPLASFTEYQLEENLTNIALEIEQLLQSAPAIPAPLPSCPPAPLLPCPSAPPPPAPPHLSLARLPNSGEFLFGREDPLAQLDAAWADPHMNLFSLVAWGGVGKTALVNHWLQRLAADNYGGARRVYAWSFYSQGASADRTVSADPFMDDALRWFGDPDPSQGSPWDKGERLARLVRQERTLLILDGLEPLQQPPGPDEGKLSDPSLQALLRELGFGQPGLCLLTTRLPVADLARFEGRSARRLDLEYLSPEAGADFLQAQKVKGRRADLLEAAEAFGGHALALTLLGTYLAEAFNGDVCRWQEIGPLLAEVQHGGHARRVLQAYEQWFGGGPELAILRLLGLFDRPADAAGLDALRAAPPIPGLTEALFVETAPISQRDWNLAVSTLRRARLLAPPDAHDPASLDAHPLVREHFAAHLQTTAPAAWREGNDRLYQHLKNTAKEQPATLAEMAPLFAAVMHGCRAGKHQEVLDEIYWERIKRSNEHFSTKKLGAFSSDLAALANFFAEPWGRPAGSLAEADQGFVLSYAGFGLRALGRLAEARQPMQAALEAGIARENWKNAAIRASNLSELSLTLGEVAQALAYARQSVELADRSGDAFLRMANRTTLADALHQAGRLAEAGAAFAEAEAMQKERQPEYPLLYSLQGFQYCDLLLSQGRFYEVRQRASQTLEWAKKYLGLLDVALDTLSLGRACLAEAALTPGFEGEGKIITPAPLLPGPSAPLLFLNQAVAGLRQAGTQNHLPRGLLARAELYRRWGKWGEAGADLAEALDLAARGGMRLFECDAHLEWARLLAAQGAGEEQGGRGAGERGSRGAGERGSRGAGERGRKEEMLAEARRHMAEAKRLAAETGYGRREGEVEEG